MSKDTPFFSVIVPAFNAEKSIPRLLESIFAQSFIDYEVILVDDCSCDQSADIIKSAVKKNPDKKLQLLTNAKNRGVSFSRNSGIKIAAGKYILFADADDYYYDDRAFEKLHDEIAETDNPDILLFGFVKEYHKLRGKKKPRKSRYSIKKWQANKNYQIAIFPQKYIWNLTARRDLINKNQLTFDENITMNEDAIWRCELLWCASTIAALNEMLYCYTRPAEGGTLTTDNEIPLAERFSNVIKTIRGVEASRRKWRGPRLLIWPSILLIITILPLYFVVIYTIGFFRDRIFLRRNVLK
ncbi:glycosyltransferase [Candidatus Saccharibacteria bacterium]|nr:glycosyltransferase [Candidatus Saccharibacteria bacterium]MCL1963263.1 glycosyltransferase [Candidatus Saccharibacteria bacterium]